MWQLEINPNIFCKPFKEVGSYKLVGDYWWMKKNNRSFYRVRMVASQKQKWRIALTFGRFNHRDLEHMETKVEPST